MPHFNHSLDKTDYSWKNCLLWGNFAGHCKKAREGSFGNRLIHALIAAIEFLPIIGQISSICEKVIVEKFSSQAQSLRDKNITTSPKKIPKSMPTPGSTRKKSGESYETFKERVSRPEYIQNQKAHKTYKSSKLLPLESAQKNMPIPLPSKATFYGYNAEGVHDVGWGCAWRAIQTCLSTYQTPPSFEELFHLFGPRENLKQIYENKFPQKTLPDDKIFAPYDLSSGWAEPFIAQMVMHFYDIPSALVTINGVPGACNAPHEVFANKPLNFSSFQDRLIKHFSTPDAAPVMIDDSLYTSAIIGVTTDGENTILKIADPHIKPGVNTTNNPEKSPAGIYTVTLDNTGKQIRCSLDHEDQHQVQVEKNCMFSSSSYRGLHFDTTKNWMILFPLPKHNP